MLFVITDPRGNMYEVESLVDFPFGYGSYQIESVERPEKVKESIAEELCANDNTNFPLGAPIKLHSYIPYVEIKPCSEGKIHNIPAPDGYGDGALFPFNFSYWALLKNTSDTCALLLGNYIENNNLYQLHAEEKKEKIKEMKKYFEELCK